MIQSQNAYEVLKVFHFLIGTNIYISLGAVMMTLSAQVQLGMEPQLHPYLFIIFFATLFEYNLHRLLTVTTNKEALGDDKHKWVKQYPRQFYVLVFFSSVGFLISLFLAKKEVLIALTPIALVTVFYSIPLMRKQKNLFRLREIPFAKIFLISAVWSAITILLPVIQSGKTFDRFHISLMLVERFVFVLAITIPFDIRDMESDKRSGLKTIPLLIGEKRSLTLSNYLMGAFVFICCFHYLNIHMVFVLAALLLSGVITILSINSKNLQGLGYYHYGVLDGTLILQGALVCIGYYFA